MKGYRLRRVRITDDWYRFNGHPRGDISLFKVRHGHWSWAIRGGPLATRADIERTAKTYHLALAQAIAYLSPDPAEKRRTFY